MRLVWSVLDASRLARSAIWLTQAQRDSRPSLGIVKKGLDAARGRRAQALFLVRKRRELLETFC